MTGKKNSGSLTTSTDKITDFAAQREMLHYNLDAIKSLVGLQIIAKNNLSGCLHYLEEYWCRHPKFHFHIGLNSFFCNCSQTKFYHLY